MLLFKLPYNKTVKCFSLKFSSLINISKQYAKGWKRGWEEGCFHAHHTHQLTMCLSSMIIGTMFSIMFFFKTCNTNQTPASDYCLCHILETNCNSQYRGIPMQLQPSHRQTPSHKCQTSPLVNTFPGLEGVPHQMFNCALQILTRLSTITWTCVQVYLPTNAQQNKTSWLLRYLDG